MCPSFSASAVIETAEHQGKWHSFPLAVNIQQIKTVSQDVRIVTGRFEDRVSGVYFHVLSLQIA
jgi:hypothetical protein